jgi:hypothetical protein
MIALLVVLGVIVILNAVVTSALAIYLLEKDGMAFVNRKMPDEMMKKPPWLKEEKVQPEEGFIRKVNFPPGS